MMPPPHKLDRIRVQTARMLEIYALLKGELHEDVVSSLSPAECQRLNQAIGIIAGNMRQLQAYFAQQVEENSPASQTRGQKLDEIVDLALRWQAARQEGE